MVLIKGNAIHIEDLGKNKLVIPIKNAEGFDVKVKGIWRNKLKENLEVIRKSTKKGGIVEIVIDGIAKVEPFLRDVEKRGEEYVFPFYHITKKMGEPKIEDIALDFSENIEHIEGMVNYLYEWKKTIDRFTYNYYLRLLKCLKDSYEIDKREASLELIAILKLHGTTLRIMQDLYEKELLHLEGKKHLLNGNRLDLIEKNSGGLFLPVKRGSNFITLYSI